MTITAPTRPSAATPPSGPSSPDEAARLARRTDTKTIAPRPRELGSSTALGPSPRDRFASLLAERKASPNPPSHIATRPDPAPKPAQRPACARDPDANVSRPIRAPREKVLERDPADLAPFRPLPAVLSPPAAPVAGQPAVRTDVSRLAEQLVTRLRVGRAKEGAVVELRLSVGDRSLDVRLVETARGIELSTDADPSMREALSRELAARGLDVTIEPRV